MATRYVATTGSDAAAGTIGAPWLTIAFAVAHLVAGDTLYLRGGTYTGASNTIDGSLNTVPSGISWANAVTIAGYPAETVITQPPNGQHGIRLAGTYSYLIFQDLTIDGVNQTL